MDTVADSLLNEETRKKERCLSIQSESNFADNRNRNKNRAKIRDMISLGKNLNLTLNLFFYNCGKVGDKKFDCQCYKRDQKVEKVKSNQIKYKKEDKNTTTIAAKRDIDVFLI